MKGLLYSAGGEAGAGVTAAGVGCDAAEGAHTHTHTHTSGSRERSAKVVIDERKQWRKSNPSQLFFN